MKQCPVCGAFHHDGQAACACGTDLTRVPAMPAQNAPPLSPVAPFAAPPAPRWRPPTPRPYSWADVLTILGFTAAITGYFWAGVLLLPLGLLASITGFRGNRCRGLAVAGVVIGAIGVVIKIMLMLDEAGLLPYWMTDGIFFS